jgi:CTP synthase (UTP-ammonia lyase)
MANSNQTFKVAGITIHNGNAKVRFTDDMVRRIKQFTKGGASRVDFVELPSEMTKVEALKYLATLPEFQSPSDQATIADTLADKTKEANKGEVKVKKTKPSLDAIKARGKKKDVTPEQILAVVEDAPF